MTDAEATLALAHALRTPLTSLALGLGLLDDGALGPLNDAQRDVIRALVADVARLSAIVGSNLRLDRLGAYAGPVERTPVDLGAIVERASSPLIPQAKERGVEVACDLAEGVVAVVDEVKMTWVVASLIGNAVRYSPRGAAVRIALSRAAGSAEIAIADEGPGMAAEVARRVLGREGGLGLFLAREIVEAHGGTIAVDAEPGRGSTFHIRMPLR